MQHTYDRLPRGMTPINPAKHNFNAFTTGTILASYAYMWLHQHGKNVVYNLHPSGFSGCAAGKQAHARAAVGGKFLAAVMECFPTPR